MWGTGAPILIHLILLTYVYVHTNILNRVILFLRLYSHKKERYSAGAKSQKRAGAKVEKGPLLFPFIIKNTSREKGLRRAG